jgi:hypothetical protein
MTWLDPNTSAHSLLAEVELLIRTLLAGLPQAAIASPAAITAKIAGQRGQLIASGRMRGLPSP